MSKFHLGSTEINSLKLGSTGINRLEDILFLGNLDLLMWLDASDNSTYDLDDDGRIETWRDKSNNGNDAFANFRYHPDVPESFLYGPKPVEDFTAMGGKTVAHFDLGIQGGAGTPRGGMGYNDAVFYRGSGSGERAVSVFISYHTPDYTYGQFNQDMAPSFISEGSGSFDPGFVGAVFQPFKAGYKQENANLYISNGRTTNILTQTSGSPNSWDNEVSYVMGFSTEDIFDAGDSAVSTSMFINDNEDTIKLSAGGLTMPTTSSTKLFGFNPADVAFPKNGLAGYVGEIIVVGSYLDATQRQTIRDYLYDKWSITA